MAANSSDLVSNHDKSISIIRRLNACGLKPMLFECKNYLVFMDQRNRTIKFLESVENKNAGN